MARGKPEHDLGRQAVAELRVDVVGAEHALGEARPHVRVLVRAARAAEHRDRRGAVRVERRAAGRRPRRRAPRATTPRPARRRLRTIGARTRSVGVHPLEAVAALVAEPTVVDRLGVDAEQAHEPVRRRLQRAAALHRARLCTTSRPSRGPTAAPGSGTALAVSAPTGQICTVLPEKYESNGSLGEVEHLHAVAAVDEVDQRVARDLVGEARAAAALDAALAVEQHEIAERDRLLEVALLLDEARLAGAERERLVLQRALAAAVAHRAVERVVDEQELEHAVLDRLHRRRSACARPCRRRPAWCTRAEAAHALDLDEAHAAHADRLHALVPAEARDVDAVLLRGLDQQLAGRRLNLAPSTVTVTRRPGATVIT